MFLAKGEVMGVMTMMSGSLYASLGSYAYFVMTVLAALSLIGALILNQQWRGEQIIGNGK